MGLPEKVGARRRLGLQPLWHFRFWAALFQARVAESAQRRCATPFSQPQPRSACETERDTKQFGETNLQRFSVLQPLWVAHHFTKQPVEVYKLVNAPFKATR